MSYFANSNWQGGAGLLRPNKANGPRLGWRLAFIFNLFPLANRPRKPPPFDAETATAMGSRKRSSCGFLRRNSGYIFMFGMLFAFMQLGFRNGRRKHIALDSPGFMQDVSDDWLDPTTLLPFADEKKKPVITEHPIPKLMEEAEEKYRKKLGSQSQTLKAAVMEYRRRYGRAPPKGFDEWWKFAQKYDVKMVDEYDGLMQDLEPFWQLPGEEIRRRAVQVGELPSIDLVRIRSGEATVINVNPNFHDSEVSARARGFRSMTGKFIKLVRCTVLHLCPSFDLSPSSPTWTFQSTQKQRGVY